MTELPWAECPTLDVDYKKPVDQRFDGASDDVLNRGRSLLAAVMSEIPDGTEYLADGVRVRTANRFHKEITSLAKLIGAAWRDLLLANISYDLTLAMFGCSTIALATPTGPVVARNMDWWPEDILAQCSCLMRYQADGDLCFANAGWPGAVGVVTGMSGRGFAVVLNAVIAPDEGPNISGYPVLLHLRRVLEDAKGFDDALRLLTNSTLASSALITLVGSQNEQRVVVERSPTKHALRWPSDDSDPLVTTNDYRLLYAPQTNASSEIYRTTCRRFDHLCSFFASQNGSDETHEVTDAQLLYALTDENVIQTITAQHILMRPRSGEVKMYVPRRLL